MKTISLLAATFLALGASTASADQASKWYAGGALGTNWVKDYSIDRQTFIGGSPVGTTKLDVDMKSDVSYFGVVGYRYSDEWSVQGELSHRSNKSDSVKVSSGASLTQNEARLKSDALMVNAIYTVQGLGAIRPYAGIGLGAARLKIDKDDGLGGANDSAWAFAYQGLVGAELELSRQWVAYGQYQYFATDKPNLRATSSRTTSAQQYDLDSYPASQTVSIGVRYNF